MQNPTQNNGPAEDRRAEPKTTAPEKNRAALEEFNAAIVAALAAVKSAGAQRDHVAFILQVEFENEYPEEDYKEEE